MYACHHCAGTLAQSCVINIMRTALHGKKEEVRGAARGKGGVPEENKEAKEDTYTDAHEVLLQSKIKSNNKEKQQRE